MHFLNPIALVGLFAAAVPLVIHLLHRGRSQPLPFSNLRFLQSLHQNRMRSIRLRQWLVLLLRTLAIAALAMAFSRPSMRSGDAVWFGRPEPVAAAILLDESYSTAYRPATPRVFDKLKAQVIELLDLYSTRDRVRVIPFASHAAPIEAPWAELADVVNERTVLWEETDIAAALEAAERHFEAWPEWSRELFLGTDLAANGWSRIAVREAAANADVYVPDLQLADRGNRYVSDVDARSWLTAQGTNWLIRADVANASQQSLPALAVDLFIDGERVRRNVVAFSPGQQATVEFRVAPRRAGLIGGYVAIEEDGLIQDNKRFFTASIPDSVRVLLVGPAGADTYYARRALEAGTAFDPTLAIATALEAELTSALRAIDVLVLCNVSRLAGAQARAVQDFASRGGGVVIFPSAVADLSYFNRHLLPGLVPVSIRDVVGQPLAGEQPASLRSSHLMRRLAGTNSRVEITAGLSESISQPRFFASYDIAPSPGTQSLLSFADGGVAVAQAWRQLGRAVLFAVPLSREWSELPASGLFAPLLHRLCRHLSQPPDHNRSYVVGQTVRRLLPSVDRQDRLVAVAPSGKRLYQPAAGSWEGTVWSAPVDEPGIWRLERKGETVDRFAVNLDTRESNLSELDPAALERIFGADNLHRLQPGTPLREQVLEQRYGNEVWREFLIAAVLLLLVELFVARAPRGRAAAAHEAASSRSAAKV